MLPRGTPALILPILDYPASYLEGLFSQIWFDKKIKCGRKNFFLVYVGDHRARLSKACNMSKKGVKMSKN